MARPLTFFALLISAIACQRGSEEPAIVVTGATVIDGTDQPPSQNAVIVIRDRRVVEIGPAEDVTIPKGSSIVDMTGKYITPGFINAHGHVGDVKGIEAGHYSRENIIDNLSIYARYGITTVVSLGGDRVEAEGLRAVNDTASTDHARLFIAGEVIAGTTPQQATAVVDSNHHLGVDFMKIRVDDNLGSTSKMSEEVFTAVIKRSHELGYKIATHMYYLDDAKKLLRAGSDLMAHSVRDTDVDDEFIRLMKERGVCYCPTLTRELSTFVYGDTAKFFTDPFFTSTYDTAIIRPLKDPVRQQQVRSSRNAITYKQQLPTAMRNLKKIADAGIPIAFGTDSGIPTRFMGYFEHLEMEMMQEAGLSPQQVIKSATSDAAKCMNLNRVGALKTGSWADFIVLDADPLADIRNMHAINAVYIGGRRLLVP